MSGASSAIGTCYHMCPVREMKWREANKLLHVFEVKNKSDKYPKVDPEKAVKQFSRSAAGKREDMPSDLRPSHVLLKTMNYLINKIIPITDVPWNVVYDFVNDRVQGIRQDITVQRIEDLNTVQIFEKCIRFYITASYILCEESSETFSQHLNRQQLQICLEKLLYLYKKFDSEYFFEFVAVFYAQSIDESETFNRSLTMFSNILSNKIVYLCIRICLAFNSGNYMHFFKYVKELPVLLVMCFFHNFGSVRWHALKAMSVAYSSKTCQIPVDVICHWLSISKHEAVVNICKRYNIERNGKSVCFNKKDFNLNASILPMQKEDFIDIKLKNIKLSDLINGCS